MGASYLNQVTCLSILYGFFPHIFLPALLLGLNAMVLGFTGAYYVNHDHSLLVYLAGILPHGIFELPALALSFSCGLFLCESVTQRLRTRKKGLVIAALSQILRIFVFRIAPLLLAAAFTETYITPAVLRLVMR